jgi:hypothetical protein
MESGEKGMGTKIIFTGAMAAILLSAGGAFGATAQIASTQYVDNIAATKASLETAGAAGYVATVDANGEYVRSGSLLTDMATTSNVQTIVDGAIDEAVEGIADNITDMATQTWVGTQLGNKADKVTGATAGNLAGVDATGNLTDSGLSAIGVTNSITEIQGDITTIEGNVSNLQTNVTNITTELGDIDLTGLETAVNANTSAIATKADKSQVGTDALTTTSQTITGAVNEIVGALDTKLDSADLTGLEATANKSTSITSASTDTQYASARAVYNYALPMPPAACSSQQCVLSVDSGGAPYWEIVTLPTM